MSRRTVVLLGAGASADAGLPLTADLAAFVVEAANRQSPSVNPLPDWVRAINATYSGMVGYRGWQGGNPLEAVSIETLISAIRLLQRRHEHEISPFVASWSASLENFSDVDDLSNYGFSLQSALASGLVSGPSDSRRVAEEVGKIARAVIRPELRGAFERAEQFVLRELARRLAQLRTVDYLTPLVDLAATQEGGLDIITLNYDLAVETIAAARGMAVNRGLEGWTPGSPLRFAPADNRINLLKLHGSLDWHLTMPHSLADSPQIRIDATSDAQLPWVVVGDREKLATEGPTLELNIAARRALERSQHLVVVGYSFGDQHINAMVRDWLSSKSDRSIAILDYNWSSSANGREGSFRDSLLRTYGRGPSRRASRPIRLVAIEGTAAAQLPAALAARPLKSPADLFSVEARRDGQDVLLRITLLDLNLTDVHIELRDLEGQHPEAFGETVALYPVPPWAQKDGVASLFGRLEIGIWQQGVTVDLRARVDSDQLAVDVEGRAPVGYQEERILLVL